MDKNYHLSQIIKKNSNLGQIIQIIVCPYEDTPVGYFYVDNKPETYSFPYSDELEDVFNEAAELGIIPLDPEDYFYDKDFGFVHKNLYTTYLSVRNNQEEKEQSKDFMSNDFDPSELSVLYVGFMNGRFSHPEKGKMFWKQHPYDRGCTLFIDKQFLDSLKAEFFNYINYVHPSKKDLAVRVLKLLSETRPAFVDELSSAYDYSAMLKSVF